MRAVSLAVWGALAPATAVAQLPEPPEDVVAERARKVSARTPGMDDTVHLTGELAGALSRGNTETLLFAANGELLWVFHDRWLSETAARVLYEESLGVNSASNWALAQRVDRFFTDRLALFAGVGFERDLFAGLKLRSSGQLGASYLLWDRIDETDELVTDKLMIELGAYVAREAFTLAPDAEPDATLAEESRPVYAARAAVLFTHAFSETATAGAGIELIQDFNDTQNVMLNASVSAAAGLTEGLALKITLLNRFDNVPAEPDPELEKNDLLLTAGVVVSL
jgi:Protein of unknown function, DUF481